MEKAKLLLEFLKVTIWPITVVIIIFVFHNQVGRIFDRLKSAELPGGTKLSMYEMLDTAKAYSQEVQEDSVAILQKKGPTIPLTEANRKMISFGLSPSPSGLNLTYYRDLAKHDPNLAFAGLRMEVESMLTNLAKGFKVDISNSDTTNDILLKLKDSHSITSKQYQFIQKILRICNTVIHGQEVTEKQANEILDIATVLRDDYVAWLSWGLKDSQSSITDMNNPG